MKYDAVRLAAISSVVFPVIGESLNETYFVKDISGLSPPEMNLNIVNLPKEGGAYYDSTPELREIVIKVGLKTNYAAGVTVEQARSSLHWMMEGQIKFELLLAGAVKLRTYGYVRRMEAVQFSKEPELEITISCLSAYLEAPNATVIGASALPSVNIVMAGNAKSSMVIDFLIGASASGFLTRRYFNGNTTDYQEFRVDVTLINGDIVRIDSTPGKKKVTRIRGAAQLNLIPYISQTSSWLVLEPGAGNQIDGALIGASSQFLVKVNKVTYLNKYWGV